MGPHTRSDSHWFIDGRSYLSPAQEGGPQAPKLADAEVASLALVDDVSGEDMIEVGNVPMDKGRIGQQYRVHLRIAGKYRVVDWEKLDTDDSQQQLSKGKVGSAASYQVVANWNGWSCEEMTPDSSQPGVFTYQATVLQKFPKFNILMNEDWGQMLYPLDYGSEGVVGPDDDGRGFMWYLDGAKPGDVVRISFQRTLEYGLDSKKVSWEVIDTATLTEEEQAIGRLTRLYLVGSWDNFKRPHELLSFGQEREFCRVIQIGLEREETFQILQDGDWNDIVHPDTFNATQKSAIRGPSTSDTALGLNWCIGQAEGATPGDCYTITVRADDYTGLPWSVSWREASSADVLAAEKDQTLLRQL
eukprot:gnl/TRDRNA2_/TRDRNA2_171982_c1_seq1.p1 gnl/TRDRNA2_/TRDRNA2_171982_c1~~gnl/TRDRNA2_/TRDRNA2_171982_c1_seq1.p1  ORF type:complete len:385 (+),score=73.58 gnl/TRDRNA2_/TRDRNA2_171982_c1_seq1:81-1157(+)